MAKRENWLSVSNYPGYEVSDKGRVRSLDRKVRSRWGTPKALKGRVLTQVLIGNPSHKYWACTLYRDGKPRQVTVHGLMLETFVGPRPKGKWGCHRDDDRDNNALTNLYWGTPAQNVQDAIKFGRHPSIAEAAKTRCPQGHRYTTKNTYFRPRSGKRVCRTCARDRGRESYHSKRRNMT